MRGPAAEPMTVILLPKARASAGVRRVSKNIQPEQQSAHSAHNEEARVPVIHENGITRAAESYLKMSSRMSTT